MDDGRISEEVWVWRMGWGGCFVRDGEAGALLQLAVDTVQVVHGSVEGEPHSFSDPGGASLRQLDFVERLVDPEGSHLGSRKPLPEERGQYVNGRKVHELSLPPGLKPAAMLHS